VLAVVLLAGCGGSGGGGGSSSGTSGSLVASVSHAKAKTLASGAVVASASISVGGVAGKHLTLDWGLVDALEGNESQAEKLVRRYVTTKAVVTTTESITLPKSVVVSPLLVHFVLYAPDGTYLASADTATFGPGS
jgi:hypothetical protein